MGCDSRPLMFGRLSHERQSRLCGSNRHSKDHVLKLQDRLFSLNLIKIFVNLPQSNN